MTTKEAAANVWNRRAHLQSSAPSESVLRPELDRLAGSLAACGVIAGCDTAESFNKWVLAPDNQYWTDSLAAVTRLRVEASKLRVDAGRYHVLRHSVLNAPLSAGFTMLTTEADIDAQCDQILAMQPERERG